MLDVSIALIFNFLAMGVIGAGPSLYALSGRYRVSAALWISPAAGFVITSLIGTYLTLLDCPVSRGSPLVLIAGVTLSIAFLLVVLPAGALKLAIDRKELLSGIGIFLLFAVLATAPQLLGGLRYSILRGNGSDSFNYITLAGYLDHEPYSWASHTDVSTLVNRHPSYERAHELLTARWTTSMMLAFTARIGGAQPYKFEYFFSVLCLLLSFGPAYVFCRDLLGLEATIAGATAFVICGGFWAQLIVDLRADSQLNSIPVLILLALLLAAMETGGGAGLWRREIILIAASGASLMFIYPEILPMTALGTVLFLGIRFWRSEASLISVERLGLAAILALVAVLPNWRLLLTFATRQIAFASAFKNNWDQAYYSWLYSSPFSGIWGFGPFVMLSPWLRILFVAWGAALTIVLLAALGRVLRPAHATSAGAGIALAFTIAAFLQWAYLYGKGQLWAGGKGLSFGFPFLLLSVAAYALSPAGKAAKWRRHWRQAAKLCVYGMLLVQCGLAFCRPLLAWRGWDYPNYIVGHGEYKRHDWNAAPFSEVLRSRIGTTVWSDISNPWVADYIGLVFGWDVRIVNIGTSRDIEDFKIPPPNLQTPPDYVFVERAKSGTFAGGTVAAENTELALVKAAGTGSFILGIANPNGIEGTLTAPFFWLGGKPTGLTVFAAAGGSSLLSGRFTIGPANPALRAIHLTLASDDGLAAQHFTTGAGQWRLPVRTKPGLNHLTIQVDDPAIRVLPTDPRPLLVRVDDLHFERQDCAPAAATVR